jgi:dienelactone hydrolase
MYYQEHTFAMRTFLFSLLLPAIILPTSMMAQTHEQKVAAAAFVDAFVARAWDRLEALSHPTMREKITREKWVSLIDGLEQKAGPARWQEFASAEPNGSYASIVHNIHFEKDSLAVRVVVDSVNLVGGFWLDQIKRVYHYPPPAYADPKAYTEREVVVRGAYELPATLSVPNGRGPFPAVLLVHGSGPSDRDQTIAGNKMFRDIAWGLASRGVMVLRYEKRTKLFGAKMNRYKTTVQEETIDDAIAAIDLLATQPETDTTRIILAGHSLGATLAPEIATKAPAIDGVAMLAPIARPLEVVINDQLRFIASMQDTMSVEERAKLDAELAKVAEIQEETLMPTKMLLNMPATYYYDLHRRDQHAYAKSLGKPILIARGTKDYQAPQMDYLLWQDVLAGVPNTAFRTYDDCYHLFIETEATPGPWNYQQEGHVVEALIDDLAAWCTHFVLPERGIRNTGDDSPETGGGTH